MEKTGRKKPIWLALLLLALLLAVIGFLVYRKPVSEEAGAGPPVGLTQVEDQDRLNRQTGEAMDSFSMNLMPEFPEGTAKGNVRIQNDRDSRYSFTVEIRISSSGESVLKTGFIDPGYYVEDMALDTPLPAGTYPAVAAVTAYDSQTKQEIGAVGIQVVIIVEK